MESIEVINPKNIDVIDTRMVDLDTAEKFEKTRKKRSRRFVMKTIGVAAIIATGICITMKMTNSSISNEELEETSAIFNSACEQNLM